LKLMLPYTATHSSCFSGGAMSAVFRAPRWLM
jgi:hypothetical protein